MKCDQCGKEVLSESGESQNVPLARNEVIVLSSEYHQLAKDARRYEWLRDNMRRMPMGEKGTRHFFDQADALSFQQAVDEATNAAPQAPAETGVEENRPQPAVAAPDTRTPEGHRQRHVELHKAFDELFADYMRHHRDQQEFLGMPLKTLLQWSYEQTIEATE